MKAIVFDRIGPPREVLELREVGLPPLGKGEARVRIVSAAISPGDFLFIEGLYPAPKKPKLPGQIAGNHGAGIVEEVGSDARVAKGTWVAFSYYNSWAEFATLPAEWLMPLPVDLPAQKAGQFFNCITAWDLLSAARVNRGDWLGITAGNATVSMMVLQFAAIRGVNVLPIVRRSHVDLGALGAAEVIAVADDPHGLRERVMEVTGGKGLDALVDNVGGPATGELVRSMAFGGRMIINGGMSPERFSLHNFDVLMKGIEIRPHVYRYFFAPPQPGDLQELREIAAIVSSSAFKVPVGGMRTLEDFRVAIADTLEHPERGKQFFAP